MSDEHHEYDPSQEEPLPEGEETPPPLTHTMAIIRWALLIGLSIFALIMILHFAGVGSAGSHSEKVTQYQCPMHPTYVSNQPGDCPICGMTLVPMTDSAKPKVAENVPTPIVQPAAEAETKTVNYACPMDPEVTSDKPGKCSKCGMNLVAVAGSPQAAPLQDQNTIKEKKDKTAKYICSMCPGVVSDKPGKCPKCGMDLVLAPGPTGYRPGNDSRIREGFFHELAGLLSLSPSLAYAGDTSMSMPMNMPMPETAKQTPAPKNEDSNLGISPVPGLVPVTIEPERLQLIGVRTGTVERRRLGGTIDIVGFITPDETHMRSLHVRVSGWVLNLFVDKTGQFVNEGQPLMSLYSQDLYQAEQDFMVARDSYKKNQSANSALVDMRRQLYEAARQRLSLLGLSDDDILEAERSELPSPQMMLRSPFSGYVLEKSVYSGQYLSPDQNLLTIADLSTVWVLGDVYEKDIPYVHEGQSARMRLTAIPGEEFQGTIGYLYPSISEKTRTMKVRLQFSDPRMRFRPGMYAEVQVQRETNQALVVPADAVMDGGSVQYAFVVHNGTHFEPRLIKVGSSSDDWVQVLSGLNEGEEVVTSANFLIDSESRLKAAVAGMGAMPGMESMSGTDLSAPKKQVH